MWAFRSQKLETTRGLHFGIDLASRPATFAAVLNGFEGDEQFRSMFSDVLAHSPFGAFRWEVPVVTLSAVTREFEFVILDCPALERAPDSGAFAEHFELAAGNPVVVIPNLGGDAIMVVPCPLAELRCYGHLAAFVRSAPQWQQHALWRAVGETMSKCIESRPVWLSTAGAGVSWLHVRIDNRPKYYAFGPYRAGGC